jgi:hypothetical protein
MRVPARFPGLRQATLLVAAAAIVWIAPEGDLASVVALSVALTLLLLIHAAQRWLGGKTLALSSWLGVLCLLGLAAGLGTGLVTLLLMAVKTGLHGHGPEFSAAEVTWILQSTGVWAATGLLGGAGLGLLTLALRRR